MNIDELANIAGEIFGKGYEYITYLISCKENGNNIVFTLGLIGIVVFFCSIASLIKEIKEG